MFNAAEPVVVSALIEGLDAPVTSSDGNILGQFHRTMSQCHDTSFQLIDITCVYSIRVSHNCVIIMTDEKIILSVGLQ